VSIFQPPVPVGGDRLRYSIALPLASDGVEKFAGAKASPLSGFAHPNFGGSNPAEIGSMVVQEDYQFSSRLRIQTALRA
jgi:hypothetical protein